MSPAHTPASALAESLSRDGAGIIADQELDERGNLVDGSELLDARGLEHYLRGYVLLAHLVQLSLLLDLSAHERSIHEARADAVDGDAVGGRLERHDLGQAQHSVLRRDVPRTANCDEAQRAAGSIGRRTRS